MNGRSRLLYVFGTIVVVLISAVIIAACLIGVGNGFGLINWSALGSGGTGGGTGGGGGTPIECHEHELTSLGQKDPTCTEEGNIACWYCETCDIYFEDACGQIVLSEDEVFLDPLGHDFSEEWEYTSLEHYHPCTRCDAQSDKDEHIYNASDVCIVCGYELPEEVPPEGGGGGIFAGLSLSGLISGPMFSNDAVIAYVYSDTSGHEYLKVKSFGDYAGFMWDSAEAYEGRLVADYSMNYLTGAWMENEYTPSKMTILNKTSLYILPSYLAVGAGGYETQSSDVLYVGEYTASYSIPYFTNADVRRSLTSIPDLGAYSAAEAAYRQFVYENYLSVPASTLEFLLQYAEEHGISASDENLIWEIEAMIRSSATYNIFYDRAMDEEEDIVVAFLDRYREGTCSHYASAATLMYRALGIPARYVTGCVCTTSAGQYAVVTGNQAHAWTEIYLDGYGWITIDATGSGINTLPGQPPSIAPTRTLQITTQDIVAEYDGTAHFSEYFSVVGLASGHRIQTFNVTKLMQVGVVTNEVAGILVYDSAGNDVTTMYKMEYTYGTITVTPRSITIETGSASKVYDGTPLQCDTYSVTSGALAEGDVIGEIVLTGTQTEHGRSQNGISDLVIYDRDGTDVTACYSIEVVAGTLTVY